MSPALPELPLTSGAPAPLSRAAAPSPATAPRAALASPPHSTRPGNSRSALRAWLIAELLLPAFRPRCSTELVWRWADRIGLPVEGGGKFLSRKKPHCRRFLSATADPRIREQHVMKASRSGYTQAALIRVVHRALHDMGNVQFTVGSLDKSRDANVRRLIPMLAHCRIIGRDEDDPDDANSKRIRIGPMSIRVVGGFTENAYKSDQVAYCINDECEAVDEIKNIGSPADGGRSRIRGLEGAQLVSISRPSAWASHHHRDVATGTLEFLAVPCPHCGTFQELTIDGSSLVDQLRIEDDPTGRNAPPLNPPLAAKSPPLGRLRFDHCKLLPGLDATANPGGWDYDRILAETTYECVSGCTIRQDDPLTAADLANPLSSLALCPEIVALSAEGYHLTHKQAMVLAGRHLRSNPRPVPADGGGPRSKRSEHNSDLTSLDFDMTWGHFAKKFAERAHDPAPLENFFNEHCGLPRRPRGAKLTAKDIVECRAPYLRGTLPFFPDLFTLCADTQDNCWKYVAAIGRLDTTGQAWRDIAVITWGAAILKADLLAALRGYRDERTGAFRPYLLADDSAQAFTATCGLVDAGGHRTDSVYELHFDSNKIFYPSYGGRENNFDNRPTWQKTKEESWRGATFEICYYRDDFWQRKMNSSIVQAREIRHCTSVEQLDPAAKGLPPRLWLPGLPADMHLAEFEKELGAEILRDGKWVKTGVQDFRDALKQVYASLDLALPAAQARRAARLTAPAPKSP